MCDFFARGKEAISYQMELLASRTGGSIVAAAKIMDQRALQPADRHDSIFILPVWLYLCSLPVIAWCTGRPIHYFEDGPSPWKRLVFNVRKRELYVSLYKRPTERYAQHIRKYRYLKRLFVELDEHRKLLIGYGVRPEVIVVSPAPAKLARVRSTKTFDPSHVTLLFASWNNYEPGALYKRGLLYLLDLMRQNPHIHLSVALRDHKTAEFEQEIARRKVGGRVALHDIASTEELTTLFDDADLVAYVAQEPVAKDVPNSILDGLTRGKPALISDAIDFHSIVSREGLGVVIPAGKQAGRLRISPRDYEQWSDRAYAYAKGHNARRYAALLDNYLLK